MQISTSYRPKMHAQRPQADPSPRLLSYQPMAPVDYSPYDHDENSSHGIVGKVTSRITGMFKDITSVVGAFFKNNEEDSQSTQSSFFNRDSNNEGKKTYHFEDHPINQVNFSDLTGILSAQPQQRKKEIEISKPEPSNKMEISFTERSFNYGNNQSDMMTNSFYSRHNAYGDEIYNDSESSMQLGKASPHSSNPDRRKKKQKVNVIRVLNYCHVRFEKQNKEYIQHRPRDSYRSLKTQLTKGLPKPMPLRSSLPTIEFKYNKVVGKYDAVSLLKKRKRREVESNQEMIEQELNFKAQPQENNNKSISNPNALKKNKLSVSVDKDQVRVHISFKGTPVKAINKDYYAEKNAYISSETYETDETEEHEEYISYKNKLFEEDEFLSGKISPPAYNPKSKKSHSAKESKSIKTTKGFKPRLIEAPEEEEEESKDDYNLVKSQNDYENEHNYQQEAEPIKTGLISPEKEVSFGDLPQSPSFPRQDLIQEESIDKNNMSQEIVPATEEPEILSNRKVISPIMISEKKPEDLQADAPTTPTFINNEVKRSNSLFGNQLNESQEIVPEVKPEKTQTVIEPEVPKIEVAPVNSAEPEIKPATPVKFVIPDFLKAYQSPAQKEKEDYDDNPFLSGKKEAAAVDTSNPFLNPSAKPAVQTQPFSISSSLLPSANTSESLNPVSSLSIFNSLPSQTNQTNNLFGNTSLASNLNSASPFANLNSNNTSTFNLFNNNNTSNNNNNNNNLTQNNQNNNGNISLFSNLTGGNTMFQDESSMGEHNRIQNQNQNQGQNTSFSLFDNITNQQQGNNWFNNSQQQQSSPFGGLQFGQNNQQGGGLFGFNQNNNNNNSNNNTGSSFLNFGSNNNNNNNNNTMNSGLSGLLGNTLNQGSTGNSFLNFNNNQSSNNNNNQMNSSPFTGFNSNNNSSNPLGSLMSQNNNSVPIQNVPQQTQEAARFLGTGSAPTENIQGRVYRRILQPGAKNRDRAF